LSIGATSNLRVAHFWGEARRAARNRKTLASSCPHESLLSIRNKRATMNILWEELTAGLNQSRSSAAPLLPLFGAILLGGLIGLQRVNEQKPVPY